MDIFVDTADIDEIQEAVESGVVDGVTTNPSLIKKAGEKHDFTDIKKYIKEILKVMENRPVSLEVTGNSYEDMKSEALMLRRLFKKNKNLIIKIPVNPSLKHSESENFEGLRLIKELSSQGILVNATLIMTPEQAVLAAKAGATYASPFAGRIDDYLREHVLGMQKGKDWEKEDYYPAKGMKKAGEIAKEGGIISGVDLIEKTVMAFQNYSFKCKILAASARNTRQVREFMLVGADVTTMPFHVLKELTANYLTVEGVIGFSNDTVHEYKEMLKDNRKFSISVTKE